MRSGQVQPEDFEGRIQSAGRHMVPLHLSRVGTLTCVCRQTLGTKTQARGLTFLWYLIVWTPGIQRALCPLQDSFKPLGSGWGHEDYSTVQHIECSSTVLYVVFPEFIMVGASRGINRWPTSNRKSPSNGARLNCMQYPLSIKLLRRHECYPVEA